MFKELVLINSPQVGLEPTTNRLTADCSTTELLRTDIFNILYFLHTKINRYKIRSWHLYML